MPNFGSDILIDKMREEAKRQLSQPSAPLELEAVVGYPGAPHSIQEEGGKTVRRFLGAYQRHALWREWASQAKLLDYLRQLFDDSQIVLSQAHHNCLMTKSPEYSSDTGWHQDIRYWSFELPQLINTWLALGNENEENGGLVVIPGSHTMSFERTQFDDTLFFREDTPHNQHIIAQARGLELKAGDLLFFHSRLLHKASRNHTEATKLSLVFTYRRRSNQPISGSRSASIEEITF